MAARATNPNDKAAWLKLAADWLSLAQKVACPRTEQVTRVDCDCRSSLVEFLAVCLVWGTRMPIRVLLAKSNLPPDEIEKLSSAFDRALRSLNIADRKDDPIGKIVARKIIEVRETGVRDAAEIADIVVKQLKLT